MCVNVCVTMVVAMQGSSFPTEVAELMKRLKTILNTTSQMKVLHT